jgi:hypothetical protein
MPRPRSEKITRTRSSKFALASCRDVLYKVGRKLYKIQEDHLITHVLDPNEAIQADRGRWAMNFGSDQIHGAESASLRTNFCIFRGISKMREGAEQLEQRKEAFGDAAVLETRSANLPSWDRAVSGSSQILIDNLQCRLFPHNVIVFGQEGRLLHQADCGKE